MLKLLGRYVAYIALIEIIIYGIRMKYYNIDYKFSARKVCIHSIGLIICTIFCYAILYKGILWNPASDWLFSLRGLDNIAYLKLGSIFLIFVCIEIGLVQIYGKRILVVCWLFFASVNIFCSVDANSFYSENHDYIESTKELMKEYGDQQVSIYSTDIETYIGSMQNYAFLYHGSLKGEIWFLEAGFSDYPMSMDTERCSFFTINKNNVDEENYDKIPDAVIGTSESNIFYFKFDESLFKEKEKHNEVKITRKEKELVVTYTESNPNIIMVLDGNIMPCKYQDGTCVYEIDKELSDNVSEAVIYDFKDLTSIKIAL